MSAAVTQFHEEEAIGKTYDFQVARRLLRYLRPYLRLLIPALALTLALNLLGILQPKFTQYAIDWHILPRKADGLMLLVGLFFGVQFFRFVFSYFQTVLLNTVGQYVMFDMRRELYDKLQHQEVAYYDRNPVGRIMTRLTNDVDALNELFTAGVTDVLGDVVMIVAIILFSIIKFDSLLLNFLIRIALVPLVAGLSYEIIRLSAKKEGSWVFKFITKPGVWLQNLTTKEPDDQQLEVAIEALKESLKLEPQGSDPVLAPLS